MFVSLPDRSRHKDSWARN